MQTTSYSIYLHIPFCQQRCGYCDFNTYAGLADLIPSYIDALCSEISFAAQVARERLHAHTIFFGGGTPSLLSPQQLTILLDTLSKHFILANDVEISLEANPGTLSIGYLKDIHSLGINRLSLGMQSAHPAELRLLERRHTYHDVIQAVTWARQAGFDNLNLDLIFGIPGQDLSNWARNLTLAAGLHPEHFSLYALTIEPGTPFRAWYQRGLFTPPDPDLAAEMYEWASDYLDSLGYTQYEISNWARSRPLQGVLVCRHNLQYWRCLPYLGFGAGAHGFLPSFSSWREDAKDGVRSINVLHPSVYIQRLTSPIYQEIAFPGTPATQELATIDRDNEIAETMIMGLRLLQEGVSEASFEARFGIPLRQLFSEQIHRLMDYGLLEWRNTTDSASLCLTAKGRLLGNQVFVEFV